MRTIASLCFLLSVPACFCAISGDVVTIRLTNAGNNVMGGVYVNPYSALIDGVPTTVICDDFVDNAYVNEVWTAQRYDIAEDDLSTTRMAQNSQLAGNATMLAESYKTAAYLATQLIAEPNATKRGQISFALWAAFDNPAWSSGALSTISIAQATAANAYLAAAKTAVSGMSLSDFSNVDIYSPISVIGCPDASHPCPTTPPQEMLVVRASEASSLTTLAIEAFGVLGLCLFLRRRKHALLGRAA